MKVSSHDYMASTTLVVLGTRLNVLRYYYVLHYVLICFLKVRTLCVMCVYMHMVCIYTGVCA